MTVYECGQSNDSSGIAINRCNDDYCESDDRPTESDITVTVCNNYTTGAVSYCVFDNVDPEISSYIAVGCRFCHWSSKSALTK